MKASTVTYVSCPYTMGQCFRGNCVSDATCAAEELRQRCNPPPSPQPKRWEVEVCLGVFPSGHPWATEDTTRALHERSIASVTLEFGEGYARVKPDDRTREVAAELRKYCRTDRSTVPMNYLYLEWAADLLVGKT